MEFYTRINNDYCNYFESLDDACSHAYHVSNLDQTTFTLGISNINVIGERYDIYHTSPQLAKNIAFFYAEGSFVNSILIDNSQTLVEYLTLPESTYHKSIRLKPLYLSRISVVYSDASSAYLTHIHYDRTETHFPDVNIRSFFGRLRFTTSEQVFSNDWQREGF